MFKGTLAFMVRDELVNPAGGLLAVLRHHKSTAPHIHVHDTGSKDGTFELLQRLAADEFEGVLSYSSGRFRGYGSSRQEAMDQAHAFSGNDYVFFIDGDELLYSADSLNTIIAQGKPTGSCRIYNVERSGKIRDNPGWSRLLDVHRTKFIHEHTIGESPQYCFDVALSEIRRYHGVAIDAIIYNFMADQGKLDHWVAHYEDHIANGTAPSETTDFWRWKLPTKEALLSDTFRQHGLKFSQAIQDTADMGIRVPPSVKEYARQFT